MGNGGVLRVVRRVIRLTSGQAVKGGRVDTNRAYRVQGSADWLADRHTPCKVDDAE